MQMNSKQNNKSVRTVIAFAALAIAVTILFIPVSAKAEDEEPDLNFVSDSVVKVSNYYHDSRDGDILLGEGYGILVGNEEKISTVLVNSSVVYVSDEKKAELMATYNKKEEKELDFFIRVQITADISTAATVHVFADNLNIAVLDMEQSIYDRKPILFDLDDDVKVQDNVYTVISPENQWKGTLINYIGENGILKISHDIPVTPDNCGAPLVNRKGELIGMLCYSNDSAHSYALDRTEIVNVLKLIGMDYAVADHNDYTVDTTVLQNAISVIEKLDMDIYTPESASLAMQTLSSAREIVADENRTQEQVDQILKDVIAIPDSLEVDNSLSGGEIVLIIATSVLSLAVIALTLILILSKVKKNDYQNRTESKTARDYYSVNEARDKKKETIVSGKKEADNYQSTQKPYVQSIPSFAQSSSPASAETECFNPDETTVLQSMDYVNSNSCDFALVGNNGERITIDKSELTVGKSSSNADYVISKPSVSRAHAKLIYRDNSLFLKDLKSTNGTFINGEKLEPDKEYLLQKGMEVKFAGEIYKVE